MPRRGARAWRYVAAIWTAAGRRPSASRSPAGRRGRGRHGGLAWCTGEVVVPLVFRHGAAEVAFNVAVAAWLVFQVVMRVRQRLRGTGPAGPGPRPLVL